MSPPLTPCLSWTVDLRLAGLKFGCVILRFRMPPPSTPRQRWDEVKTCFSTTGNESKGTVLSDRVRDTRETLSKWRWVRVTRTEGPVARDSQCYSRKFKVSPEYVFRLAWPPLTVSEGVPTLKVSPPSETEVGLVRSVFSCSSRVSPLESPQKSYSTFRRDCFFFFSLDTRGRG